MHQIYLLTWLVSNAVAKNVSLVWLEPELQQGKPGKAWVEPLITYKVARDLPWLGPRGCHPTKFMGFNNNYHNIPKSCHSTKSLGIIWSIPLHVNHNAIKCWGRKFRGLTIHMEFSLLIRNIQCISIPEFTPNLTQNPPAGDRVILWRQHIDKYRHLNNSDIDTLIIAGHTFHKWCSNVMHVFFLIIGYN